jgi:6-phosphofructokinase
MKPIRTIGIVNGGGGAPGRNPVKGAIVRASINEHRMRVVGVLNGLDGLRWPVGGRVANTLGYPLREMLHKEIAVTVLGHVQRGGSPTPFDRILGRRFGVVATDVVASEVLGAWFA